MMAYRNRNNHSKKTLGDILLVIFLCVLFGVLGICMVIGSVKGLTGFVMVKKKIVEFSQNSCVIEGEIKSVSEKLIHEDHYRFERWYTLYSADVVYINEQGEEACFETDYYKKKMKPGKEIKLIYDTQNETIMDIAYFDVYTFRMAPMHYYLTSWTPVLMLLWGGVGVVLVRLGIWFVRWDERTQKEQKLIRKSKRDKKDKKELK